MAAETMQAVIAEGGKCKLVERPVPTPKANEILIKIAYTGVNRLDVIQASGKLPVPPGVTDIMGLEASGEVVAAGDACTKFKVGDKVVALLVGGGYAEYAVSLEDHAMPIPDGFGMKQAASIAEQWITAYQILMVIGEAKAGETALVHAAGSGVGTAALQLARLNGVKTIATAGSEEKLATAAKLGAMLGINYKKGSWKDAVLEATGGKGVNVILDCVGGQYVDDHTAVVGLDSRWVLYGLLGGADVSGPFLRTLLRKRVKLQATTLRTRSNEYKTMLVQGFIKDVLPHFATNKLSPVIDSTFELAKVQDAQDYVSSNKSHGKVLLAVAGGDGAATGAGAGAGAE